MKKLIILSLVAFMTSCSSLQIGYDYDKQADFTKYKTFNFSQDALNLPVDQLNRDRILRAVETEMTAKGFTKTATNPDVLIDLQVKAKQETEATATNTGGMYGGRYGFAGGYGTTSINYYQYTVGSLFINMVDMKTERIVWQGRGSKTIDEDASPSKRDANISAGVKAIYTKYPPKP